MEFKNWLYLENDQYEIFEEAIAAYTYYHFHQALNKFFIDGKKKKLEEYMQEKWGGATKPNNNGGIRFYLPNQIGRTTLPKEMIDLRICVDLNPNPNEDGAGATSGHGIIEVHYDPRILQDAKNSRDSRIVHIAKRIQYQLYHETTHLMSGRVGPSATMQTTPWWKYPKDSKEYRNGQLNYYTDPGEVKAHAKQYAIMYMNRYPAHEYSLEKLLRMAADYDDNKLRRYAEKLGNPKIQRQFPEFAEKMQQAYELFHNLIQKFVAKKGYRHYTETTLTKIKLYGWLSPTGMFNSLKGMGNHGDYAKFHTGLQWPDSINKMFHEKWQRITFYGQDVYMHNPINAPTSFQIKKLKDLAIENEYNRIIYDNEDADKIIWDIDYDN